MDKNARGIFHVTNRGSCTWYDFARKILKEARLDQVELSPMKTGELQRAARRPAYSVLGMQKFVAATGKTAAALAARVFGLLFVCHQLRTCMSPPGTA